jgi:predicted nucleic-acid-binding protein
MKKVLIDSNVWLRYFLKDNEEQFLLAKKLIDNVENNKIYPYISSMIFMEIVYVLGKLYLFKKDDIKEVVESILLMRNIVVIKDTDFIKAWRWCNESGVKLADCLIATSMKEKVKLATFDNEFNNLKEVQLFDWN